MGISAAGAIRAQLRDLAKENSEIDERLAVILRLTSACPSSAVSPARDWTFLERDLSCVRKGEFTIRGTRMSEDVSRAGAADLWRLSVRERSLSGMRRQLHAQIDSGARDESIRMRERRLSRQRRALHRQIDELRAARGARPG